MMHECPRCKFVQPKDQYCANCGLDISTYTPARPSLAKRLASSTALQIVLVVLAVVVAGALIFFSQKEKLAAHLRAAPQTVNTDMPVEATAPTLNEVETTPSADAEELAAVGSVADARAAG